ADQPDLLVVAQCRLAEPAAPGDILDGESRHDFSKPNLKRLKSRTARRRAPAPPAHAVSIASSEPGLHDRVRGSLDGVPGRFGVVAASGWGGPAEGAVGELVDGPAGLLLEPVVMTALRAAVAQASPAACLVRRVVLE